MLDVIAELRLDDRRSEEEPPRPLAPTPANDNDPRRLTEELRRAQAVADILHAISDGPLELIEVGDMIQFECADDWSRVITVLGIKCGGAVDAMVYDGEAHYFETTADAILSLRVLRRDRLSNKEISIYRRILGLNPEIEEAA